MMENINFLEIVLLIIALIIAVVGHEIAHGWVAYKYGDFTAKYQGRLSINPIKHIDILGTIIVPGAMYLTMGVAFGWAKPVPINTSVVVRNGGYLGAIWVSLAGIIYNLLLAFLASILLKFGILSGLFGGGEAVMVAAQGLYILIVINIILALFNLYPIPPLDGSHVVAWGLRYFGAFRAAYAFESVMRYGFIILIIIVISPLGKIVFSPIYQAVGAVRNLLF